MTANAIQVVESARPRSMIGRFTQLLVPKTETNSARFTRHYLDSLEAQFRTLPPSKRMTEQHDAYANAETILDKYRNNTFSPSWTDLMQLDLSIIQLLDGHHLQLKIAELRQRVTAAPYHGRIDVPIPLDQLSKNGNEELLRAEAVQLATRLWQIRKVRNEKDRQLKNLVVTQTNIAFLVLGSVFLLVMIDRLLKHSGFSFLPVLFAFGVLGAFVSVLRRLNDAIGNNGEPDLSRDFSALENEGERLWISLITGGIFSVLLYFLFSSGAGKDLLGGSLIPQFNCGAKCPTPSGDSFLTVNLPINTAEFAKCIVWSFLAGFSEQLVPDVLDKLAKKKA